MTSARVLLLPAILLVGILPARSDDNPAPAGTTRIQLAFLGGHDIDPRDHGRPVVLVAAALGVPPDVFRDAFSHVHPAPAGQQPTSDEVHDNKRQLLLRLAKYGVTNKRLDEVSNYYRYRPQNGEMWRHVDAAGFALIKDGKIVRVTITERGAGYTTAPKVVIQGVALCVYPLATLSFGKDLGRNGSIVAVVGSPVGDMPDSSGPQSHEGVIDHGSTIEFSPAPAPPPAPPPH